MKLLKQLLVMAVLFYTNEILWILRIVFFGQNLGEAFYWEILIIKKFVKFDWMNIKN